MRLIGRPPRYVLQGHVLFFCPQKVSLGCDGMGSSKDQVLICVQIETSSFSPHCSVRDRGRRVARRGRGSAEVSRRVRGSLQSGRWEWLRHGAQEGLRLGHRVGRQGQSHP